MEKLPLSSASIAREQKKLDLSIVTSNPKACLKNPQSFSHAMAKEQVSYEVLDIANSEWFALEFERTLRIKTFPNQFPWLFNKEPQPPASFLSLARNELAFFQATGKYLLFLSTEDEPNPQVLSKMIRMLDRHPKCGVAIAAVEPLSPNSSSESTKERLHFLLARETLKRTRSRFSLLSRLLFSSPVLTAGSCIISRRLFLEVGGFNPELPAYEDIDLFVRAIRERGFSYIDDVILKPKSTSRCSKEEAQQGSSFIPSCYQSLYKSYKMLYGNSEYLVLRLLAMVLESE